MACQEKRRWWYRLRLDPDLCETLSVMQKDRSTKVSTSTRLEGWLSIFEIAKYEGIEWNKESRHKHGESNPDLCS